MTDAALKIADRRFREDIALQLREAAASLAIPGLSWEVRLAAEQIALELKQGEAEEPLRIVAAFNGDRAGRAGWDDWLQLRMETADSAIDLLTLAWLDGGLAEVERDAHRLAQHEARADAALPLNRRGLNADADIREGRYARGYALRLLKKDLRAIVQAGPIYPVHRPLFLPEASGRSLIPKPEPPIDVDFAPIREVSPPVRAVRQPLKVLPARNPSPDELKERLIAEVFEAMLQHLSQMDASLAGAGGLSTAKAALLATTEWAMLLLAYAIEAKTNQVALASFLPDKASWLYGLVGPLLIGGLAALTQSRVGRAGAFALLASWALAMAVVTASDKNYLDGAQAWFPTGPAILTREEALAKAKLDRAASEKEVARLEGKRGVDTAALIADAKKRWQAKELKALGQEERQRDASVLAAAKTHLQEALGRVTWEEFALRDALLKDESRNWAWRSLFLIFGVINFAGPFAISRVLEKWQKEHAPAKDAAQEQRRLRHGAVLFRHGTPAHKARAIKLMAAAMDKLAQDGIPAEILERLNAAELANMAADRFDRTVNAAKFQRRLRIWGPAQN